MQVRLEREVAESGPRAGRTLDVPAERMEGRLGAEHTVLAIRAETGPTSNRVALQFFIKEGRATPAWFPASMFSVVDDTIPATWRAALNDKGVLMLAPARWLDGTFWMDFGSEDSPRAEEAQALFEQEKALMEADLGRPSD